MEIRVGLRKGRHLLTLDGVWRLAWYLRSIAWMLPREVAGSEDGQGPFRWPNGVRERAIIATQLTLRNFAYACRYEGKESQVWKIRKALTENIVCSVSGISGSIDLTETCDR